MKYDVFISYRRDGGEYTARILRDRLSELGYQVFFDVESLRSGNFNTKLYSVIEECTDFIIVLSPNALDRCVDEDDWVRREVEYALERKKNVVPVMLRGFTFPKTLPDSLEALRYQNGIEANSQFFEAFLQKLQQFLSTKPALRKRVVQNSVVRKTVPLFLAMSLLAVVSVGVFLGVNALHGQYPRTKAEKNLTSELIYYIETNLTNLELIADATDDAMRAAERYLLAGDQSTLEDKFDVSWNALSEIDLSKGEPTEDFINRLGDSPFAVPDAIALHDSVKSFWEECVSNLTYIELVTSEDYYLSDSDKMEIVSNYQTILDESVKIYAYGSNDLLLPVTNSAELEEFRHDYLPMLTHIPLTAVNWCNDKAVLDSATDECFNKMDNALRNLAVLVGNTSMDNATMKEALILSYMNVGYTREQAEEVVYLSLEIEEMLEEVREKYSPEAGDDSNTLWWKMLVFISVDLYEEALECLDVYEVAVQSADQYAKDYVPAMRLFIQNMETIGIDYGAIVMGYYEPDGINEVLEIGDIIFAVDGKACHTYEEYIELKGQATENTYTVDILRANDRNELEQITLQMTKDMPRVTVGSVTSEQYE